MIALAAEEVAEALGLSDEAQPLRGSISTDTRTLRPGDLFVAIRGENYDGHAFVPAAFAMGATAAVVEMGARIAGDVRWQPPGVEGRLYRVVDTRRALGLLARAVRRKSRAKVIAVTGSVGKTSTKDLIRALAAQSGRVMATAGNENNEIGVPLSLLRLDEDTDVAVLEMGMRGRGQIRDLLEIAEPDVGVITKIAPVHLESVGDLGAVAAAKAELIEGLDEEKTAVVPVEPLLDPYVRRARCRVVRFAYGAEPGQADVVGVAVRAGDGGTLLRLHWPQGVADTRVSFTGRHRLENSVAAAAACWATGLDLARCLAGLEAVEFTPSRGDEVEVGGLLIIDDTYNANPAAVKLALEDLVARAEERGGRAVAVLGDMLELGPGSREYHREVGMHAARVGVEVLWGIGRESQAIVEGFLESAHPGDEVLGSRAVGGPIAAGTGMSGGSAAPAGESGGKTRGQEAHHELELNGIEDKLMSSFKPGDVVLVKASRGMRLDRLVSGLIEQDGRRG